MSEEHEAIRDLVAAICSLDWFVRRVHVSDISGEPTEKVNAIIERVRAAVRRGRACLPEWRSIPRE